MNLQQVSGLRKSFNLMNIGEMAKAGTWRLHEMMS